MVLPMMKVMRRDTVTETGIVLQIAMITDYTIIIPRTFKLDIMMVITMDLTMAK
jgi:hypothetical protein